MATQLPLIGRETGEGDSQMLKISIERESDEKVLLLLEGSLSGPWVQELKRVSLEALATSKSVALDLEKLRFVDTNGAALLRELKARRVAQINGSQFISQHLDGGNER
jgi:anti-anti-sigma regulatory factor